jgi:hypothetical protein
MRKDIFTVGARITGIWQLLAALNTFSSLLSAWLGWLRAPGYGNESATFLHFGLQLFTGLFLVFRSDTLYNLLSQLDEPAEPVETKDK